MLCSGSSVLGEVENKQGVFQEDTLSSLVFVLALIPLSLILRRVKAACNFSDSKEKIDHVLFMDGLKLYSQSEKGLEVVCFTALSGNLLSFKQKNNPISLYTHFWKFVIIKRHYMNKLF